MARPIHPVILSGGSGERLWPLSRASYPKQLLALNGEETLFQQTVRRVHRKGFAPPLIICNNDHRFIIAEQLLEMGIKPAGILLEPQGRNTAPAAICAALYLQRHASADEAEPLMLLLPSDHALKADKAFFGAVGTAAKAAEEANGGALVTFGITPTKPDTGFGYIERGDPVNGLENCFSVHAFKEKPDEKTAKTYVKSGRHSWNSGMFLLPAQAFLQEARRLVPQLTTACEKAVDKAATDLDFIRLDAHAFETMDSISIDYAIMEHTDKAACVPLSSPWSDLGAWDALWQEHAKDAEGNVIIGDAALEDSSGTFVHSSGPLVAALGIKDLVIIATDDAVMVTPKSRAQDIKILVSRLKAERREEVTSHTRVHRPWGYFQTVEGGEGFQVKRLCVNPGARLSLQKHAHRAEHWVVVRGSAKVTRGDDVFQLQENESAYIPMGTVHCLENPGIQPLHVIEVQSGSYLGEDDIERLDDPYKRGDGET